MSKRFYITCPIYYPSAKPHVGTAYTTVLSDVLTRYKKLLGYDAFLTVGTDEHALKILTNAKKAGKEPMDFLNDFYAVFKEL
ncbi:class I tRNA ligase family protein [bacterium]|nr:class I tRNA ligase family protein [bacterium]